MQSFYYVEGCGYREEVNQVFAINVSQPNSEGEITVTPAVAITNGIGMVAVFVNPEKYDSIEACNEFIKDQDRKLFDMSDWKSVAFTSVENFSAMRDASANIGNSDDGESTEEAAPVESEAETTE